MCVEMISKQEFCDQIEVIRDFLERMNVLKDVLDVESTGDVTVYDMIVDNNISNLSTLTEDEDGWIYWFVYETNFGSRNCTVNRIGRKTKRIDTPAKLYNLIEQQRNLVFVDNHKEYPVDNEFLGHTVYITDEDECANIRVYNSMAYGILVAIENGIAVIDKYKELEYL